MIGEISIKAITLTQPYATLMASGAKMIETRTWYHKPIKRGQWIAIHAAKGPSDFDDVMEFCELCISEPFRTALNDAFVRGLITSHKGDGHLYPSDLPRGAVVAMARFAEARQTQFVMGVSAKERAFGNYARGRWAWIFDEVKPITPPIPAKGALYLWDWTPPVGLVASAISRLSAAG